jgi:hypothetical protein
MAVGGFINGLRPVNLALPLLQKAGMALKRSSIVDVPMTPAPSSSTGRSARKATGGADFGTLVFSSRVTADGRPINPAAVLPSGGKELYATFEYTGMRKGRAWGLNWAWNGKKIASQQDKWEHGSRGRKTVSLQREDGLPDGLYHLVLTIGREVKAEGEVVVGRRQEDTDSEISGQLVDEQTKRGIAKALVIALRPDVKVAEFLREQRQEMAFTSARTDRNGRFTFPKQLPKGQAYGLVVVARGYRDLAIEKALRVSAQTPERAQLNPIPMRRG